MQNGNASTFNSTKATGQGGKRETEDVPRELRFPVEKALQPDSLELPAPLLSLFREGENVALRSESMRDLFYHGLLRTAKGCGHLC